MLEKGSDISLSLPFSFSYKRNLSLSPTQQHRAGKCAILCLEREQHQWPPHLADIIKLSDDSDSHLTLWAQITLTASLLIQERHRNSPSNLL